MSHGANFVQLQSACSAGDYWAEDCNHGVNCRACLTEGEEGLLDSGEIVGARLLSARQNTSFC